MSNKTNNKSTKKKKSHKSNDFLDIMISPPAAVVIPGKNSEYLYSSNYQPIEKLVSKYGQNLGLSEAEYKDERKLIWHNLKSKCDKVDETVPFSGFFTQNSKAGVDHKRKLVHKKKRHQMRLRTKKKFLDKEDYV